MPNKNDAIAWSPAKRLFFSSLSIGRDAWEAKLTVRQEPARLGQLRPVLKVERTSW